MRLPGEVHTANLVFLGRGRARGQVRYDDGTPIPNVYVSVGSTLHSGIFSDVTDADGRYEVTGLPVAPLTFTVVDPDGRTTFAASQLRVNGEVLTQDLVVLRKESPGLGVVRLVVTRSDSGEPVGGATVGVSTQGYPLQQGTTDANGRYEFRDVPAGLVTILASQWNISRHAVGIEVDLRADQTLEQTVVLQVPDATAILLATRCAAVLSRNRSAAPCLTGSTTRFAPPSIARRTSATVSSANAYRKRLHRPRTPPARRPATIPSNSATAEPVRSRVAGA